MDVIALCFLTAMHQHMHKQHCTYQDAPPAAGTPLERWPRPCSSLPLAAAALGAHTSLLHRLHAHSVRQTARLGRGQVVCTQKGERDEQAVVGGRCCGGRENDQTQMQHAPCPTDAPMMYSSTSASPPPPNTSCTSVCTSSGIGSADRRSGAQKSTAGCPFAVHAKFNVGVL